MTLPSNKHLSFFISLIFPFLSLHEAAAGVIVSCLKGVEDMCVCMCVCVCVCVYNPGENTWLSSCTVSQHEIRRRRLKESRHSDRKINTDWLSCSVTPSQSDITPSHTHTHTPTHRHTYTPHTHTHRCKHTRTHLQEKINKDWLSQCDSLLIRHLLQGWKNVSSHPHLTLVHLDHWSCKSKSRQRQLRQTQLSVKSKCNETRSSKSLLRKLQIGQLSQMSSNLSPVKVHRH